MRDSEAIRNVENTWLIGTLVSAPIQPQSLGFRAWPGLGLGFWESEAGPKLMA